MKNKFKLTINTNCGESKKAVKTPDIVRRAQKTHSPSITKHRVSVIKINKISRTKRK